MFVAPGPIEVVQAIMRRRRFALAKATAASAIACSLCARNVGSRSLAAYSASPKPATLPWPKIATTPAKRACSWPSVSPLCEAKKTDERLRHREADRGHRASLAASWVRRWFLEGEQETTNDQFAPARHSASARSARKYLWPSRCTAVQPGREQPTVPVARHDPPAVAGQFVGELLRLGDAEDLRARIVTERPTRKATESRCVLK